jgi:hypothetical protein
LFSLIKAASAFAGLRRLEPVGELAQCLGDDRVEREIGLGDRLG